MTRLDRAGVGLLALLSGVLYALTPLLRFRQVSTPSYDNAIFEQAIAAYARLGPPIVPIKGQGFNLLGDHFSPAIAVVAPFYRLVPDPRTLFVAQAVALAASVAVVGRVAVSRLGRPLGVGLAIAYAGSFGLLEAVAVDFHEVCLAVPLLALAGAAWLRDDVRGTVAWTLPLLLVKEDLAGTVVAVGAVLILARRRRSHPGAGLALVVAGVVGGLLVLFVIVPSINPSGAFTYLGDNAAGGSGSVAVSHLTERLGQKAGTLALTLAATGGLALLSPWALLAVPTILWRYAGNGAYYPTTTWHYSLVLMPVLFVAAVDALERHRTSHVALLQGWVRLGVPAALVVAAVMAHGGRAADVLEPSQWRTTARLEAADAVVAAIPGGAVVESDIGLITRLVTDHQVWWVGTVPASVTPAYVVVDEVGGGWGEQVDPVTYAETQHPGTRYRLWLSVGDFRVARLVR